MVLTLITVVTFQRLQRMLITQKLLLRAAVPISSSFRSFSPPSKTSTTPLSSADVKELIIYEDNHLIAVNKPSNILTQSDISGHNDLHNLVKAHLKISKNKPGDVYLGLMHRIDRPCSGLIMFAKTSKAAARISEQLRNRKIIKKYVCIVEGELTGEGVCEDYLRRSRTYVNKTVIAGNNENVDLDYKLSTLRYKSIMIIRNEDQPVFSLISIDLESGRKHQIRVQLSHLGHPIAGDKKYAAKTLSKIAGLPLHAYLLSLYHPAANTQQLIIACPPIHWAHAFGIRVVDEVNRLIQIFRNDTMSTR